MLDNELDARSAKKVVSQKLQAFLMAYKEGDVDSLKKLFSVGSPSYVGTGSHEVQHGHNNIVNQFKSDFEQSRPAERVIRFSKLKSSVYRGSIGCLVCAEYCPDVGPPLALRMSGFVVNEDEDWKWASMHFSFPAEQTIQSPGDSIPVPPSSPTTFEEVRRRRSEDSVDLLLIAPTEVARNAVLKRLVPWDGALLRRVDSLGHSDHVGKFGSFDAVVTEFAEANVGVEDAMRMWRPKAVVIVGVAWRMNDNGFQRGPGDVVISQEIIPYEAPNRRAIISAARTLFARSYAQECTESWEYSGGDNTAVYRCYHGPLLSANENVGIPPREELCEEFPSVVGLDLQSAHLCGTANAMGIDWIVAKGICKWGDTDARAQVLPTNVAVDFLHHVFSNRHALDEVL